MALVVFRADAGPTIGAGHVMRLLSLAHVFRAGGWQIGFAATQESFESVAALAGADAEKLVVKNKDDTDSLRANWPHGADLLIVDHYKLDESFERKCRPWAKRILAIDDLADRRHDADAIVDAVCRSPDSYRELVPPACSIHCGPAFAPLHPDFPNARAAALARRVNAPVERILVSFGQIDVANATLQALDAIGEAGISVAVDVALSLRAPHLDAIRGRISGAAKLHIDANEMPALMSAADIAIGAGGTTTWERCCLGLPAIALEIAGNQHQLLDRVQEAGALTNLGIAGPQSAKQISAALRDLTGNAEKRARMSAAAAKLVDGRGSSRILLAAIGAVQSKTGESVTLRLAEESDEAWLLQLQEIPETRRYANTAAAPSPSGHHVWFAQTLSDGSKLLAIICVGGEPAGMLRLDRTPGASHVSIALMPDFYKRGVGAAALALATRISPGNLLRAEVKPENSASLALFRGAGYRHLRENLYVREPK
jgi:UDP-2,4-diacetamido-2,4,6-trideoxy-beta-L-altropyranose hydrolase